MVPLITCVECHHVVDLGAVVPHAGCPGYRCVWCERVFCRGCMKEHDLWGPAHKRSETDGNATPRSLIKASPAEVASLQVAQDEAEERGVRWGLDHCHDLAVAAGDGAPNTSVDRAAVAKRIACRARRGGQTEER